MLSLLSKHINKNHIGLYRNDILTILKNTNGPEAEKLKKKFQKLFKEKDLHIIFQSNLKTTNNLGIKLNLKGSSHLKTLKTQKTLLILSSIHYKNA